MGENISRRSFLQKLVGAVMGITALFFAIPAIRYLTPKREEGGANILTDTEGKAILESEIKEGSSLIGFSKNGPTIVVRRGGKLHALSAACTHLGCLVKWIPNEDIFFCPCHAGKFDANGVNISGPPPSGLATYNVEIDSKGKIILS